MAELGLRPTEVNKLIVKKDPTTKEFYWFCTYEKKGGGGTTEPRRIEPLPLLDRDGKEVKWNLMERFKSNLLPLPERVTGEAAGTYLKRRESWIQLKADMRRQLDFFIPENIKEIFPENELKLNQKKGTSI